MAEWAQSYQLGYLSTIAGSAGRRTRWVADFEHGYERQTATLTAYIEDAWTRLETGDTLTDDLDLFRVCMIRHRDRFADLCATHQISLAATAPSFAKAAARIVSSYVHMNNNRLGVSIPEEAYLAHIIHRSLAASVEGPRRG